MRAKKPPALDGGAETRQGRRTHPGQRVHLILRGATYHIRWQQNGRRFEETTDTSDPRRAEEVRAKRGTEIFENKHFPDKKRGDLSLADLRDRWLEHAAGKKKKSAADDRERLDRILAIMKPHTRVAALQRTDIVKLRQALDATVLGGAAARARQAKERAPSTKRLSVATVNRHIAVLRAALRLAAKDGYAMPRLDSLFADAVHAEHNARDRIATQAEVDRILAAASPDLALFVTLAYWTGCRAGELAALEWKRVDLARGMIALESSGTKTGEARRVPLPKPARDALAARPRPIEGGRVFAAKGSGTFSSAFSKLTRKIGIADLRLHDFRHTALTNLRRSGVDLITLKKISGHKTFAMLERYNTVDDDDLLAAARKVSDFEGRR